MSGKQLFANNVSTTLYHAVSPGDTYIVISPGGSTGIPTIGAGEFFNITLEEVGKIEILKVTGVSGDTLTVARGQEGTTAQSFSAGAIVEMRITAATLESFARLQDRMFDLALMRDLVSPRYCDSNSYIIHQVDEAGRPVLALKNGDDTWGFPTYSRPIRTGTVTSGARTSLTSAGVSVPLTVTSSGKYLIQFTSGHLSGNARMVTGSSAGVVAWVGDFVTPPQVGDSFEIYQSLSSYVATEVTSSVVMLSNVVDTDGTMTATAPDSFKLTTGCIVEMVPPGYNNFSSVTLRINSEPAKQVVRRTGTSLYVGELIPGVLTTLVYDGVYFRLLSNVSGLDVLRQTFTRAISGGSPRQIIATLNPQAPLAAGTRISLVPVGAYVWTEGESPTLNLNNTGDNPIVKRGSNGSLVSLASGDYNASGPFMFEYNGQGQWILLDPLPSGGSVADHLAAVDPHTQYLTTARGDSRYAPAAHNHDTTYELRGVAEGTMNTHIAAANPHPQYGTYTWANSTFALREPLGGLGATRVAGGEGATPLSSGYEVYVTEAGQHQLRAFIVNCS